jgi:hypothetical protein
MSLENARYFAECWVDKYKERILEIIDEDFKFRDFFLRELLVDDSQTAYAGLPAIYLTVCAQHDPTTFDILVNLLKNTKQQPPIIEALRESIQSGTFKRPKPGRGRPYKSAGRDFILYLLVAMLQKNFEDLSFGAGADTENAEPATQIALDVLEKAGFFLFNYQSGKYETPPFRLVEKSIRRFEENPKNREFFYKHPRSFSTPFNYVPR